MDWDSKSERISEHLALSLYQHSGLTAISVGFINMERHKSLCAKHADYTRTLQTEEISRFERQLTAHNRPMLRVMRRETGQHDRGRKIGNERRQSRLLNYISQSDCWLSKSGESYV